MSMPLKNMSLVPKGLRYKTMVAFALTSIIPLLICFWLVVTYIFPNINVFFGLSLGNISLILFIGVAISMLGLYVTKEMIDPVIKIASDARIIAKGDLSRIIEIGREDEIGDLSTSLNMMTQKIRDNMNELKTYSEKTKLINIEINKKVLALSNLLQIGNLISSSSDVTTALNFITEKLAGLEEGSVALFMLLDDDSGEFKPIAYCNVDEREAQNFRIKKKEAIENIVVVDRNAPATSEMLKKMLAVFDLKNIIMMPIVVYRKQYAMVAVGNRKEDFVFEEEEKELLKVFLKQASIAVENDILIRRTRELAVKDELTGLYNESYINSRLDEEIKRAILRQRPCGYLLIDVDDFRKFHEQFGEEKTGSLLKRLGDILKDAVTEVDRVARLTTADRFAIVLPERNKKQSASLAEEIRKKVETNLGNVMKISSPLTVSVGVSENPIDGSSATELTKKAEGLLKSAKSLGKNRIAV